LFSNAGGRPKDLIAEVETLKPARCTVLVLSEYAIESFRDVAIKRFEELMEGLRCSPTKPVGKATAGTRRLKKCGIKWLVPWNLTFLLLAATATLRDAWPHRLTIAGYSVGEVAGWSVAGLMDATMTLDLVSRRPNAMDAPSRPGDGLLFVRGLSYAAVEDLCNRYDAAIAIVNPSDAFILGGPGVALDIIADVAKMMGAARAVRLAMNVSSHTPRLAAASSEFRKLLDQTPTKLAPDSNVRLFSGIDGSPVINISAGLNKLAKQISHTVQWARCLEGCVEAGASVFFELGPGLALNEMAAGAYPDISARSLEDFRTLQSARAWLTRVVN
jgi:[acyl-carrier-protein] S-malonyltransferase